MRQGRFAASLLFLIVSIPVRADIIGYQPSTTFGGLDGASAFDALFAAAGHTLQAVDLDDSAAVDAVDALWLHGGSYSLSPLASGRNVVYITDRSDGGPWAVSSPSVLNPLGGDDVTIGGDNAIHATVGGHALVDGVATLRFNTWSAVNPLLGSPTLLTASGMAAVYSFGMGELLFIGDTNWQYNAFEVAWTGGADNIAFAHNIVSWLPSRARAVSEPGTLALLAFGLFGMASSRRRKGVAA